MNFFKKIFGFSQTEKRKENKKIRLRDTLKNEKYFRKELERLDRWFEDFLENDQEYKVQYGELTPFHYYSRTSDKLQRIETMYSLGLSINEIMPIYKETLPYYFQSFEEYYRDYDQSIQIICFAILLELPKEEFHKIKDFIYDCDKKGMGVISFLLYLMGDQRDLDQKPKGEKYYYGLYKISKLPKPEAEKAIKKYLDKWYEMHKDDAWYDSHLRSYGYSGYWAWEVAALVKVMGLDDRSFKNHQYYPYDMVHWKELMKNDYLPDNDTMSNYPHSQLFSVYNTRGTNVPIYEYPSTMVAPIGYLDNDITVLVLEYNQPESWCQVFTKEKKRGYIQCSFIKKSS